MNAFQNAGPDQPLLALDIGTRKVAGVVVAPGASGGMTVLAAAIREHTDRAMLDGQVHKVEAVAEVVRQVKAELEEASGLRLTHAAVAAAGRALLTESSRQTRRFPYPLEITRDHVRSLELEGARAAQTNLQAREKNKQLHCVGFSTVQFFLDGQPMDDLVGHIGQEIGVQVLATFLPRPVVDSLMAVLRRAELAAASLTLEPIAAIDVTIPPDLRRMNLALVDVGAGTSDIAVTRQGAVFAYAMVTVAGDEITEKLCEHYLLDFAEAERLKRAVEGAGSAALGFTTILGQRQTLSAAEVMDAIRPDVEKLARAIADTILGLNGGTPPRAVVMVGGGSATPGLGPLLSAALGIEPNRVGVRGPETIANLHNPTGRLMGIEGVTLYGIASSALKGQGLRFVNAQVNEMPVQLLALTEAPTVFEALLSAGREVKKIYPRPGAALTYTLAGKLHTVPGSLGQPSRLALNGAPATLDTPVAENSRVEFQEAQDGEPGTLLPDRVPKPQGPHWCSINGINHELDLVLANQGEPVDPKAGLPDRAELEWVSAKTLAELLPDILETPAATLTYRVNGELRRLENSRLTVNGEPANPGYRPRLEDRIEWSPAPAPKLLLREAVGTQMPTRSITVIVNGRPRVLDAGGGRVMLNGRTAGLDELVPDHSEIQIEPLSEAPILSQVLEGLNLKPPKDAGPLKMRVDGREAGFTTPLQDGSRVEISFS